MYAFAWIVVILAVGSLCVAAGAGWWLNRNQHRYPLAEPEHAPPFQVPQRESPPLYDQDEDEPIRNDTPPEPPPERKPIVGLE